MDDFVKAAESGTTHDMNPDDILSGANKDSRSKAVHQIALDCLKLATGRMSLSSGKELSDGRPQDQQGPLLRYAYCGWMRYSQQCVKEEAFRDDLLELLKALFDPSNLPTLEKCVQGFTAQTGPPDPLYYAVNIGQNDIIRHVLDKTERSSWRGGPGGKALQRACYLGNTSIVRELLRKFSVDEADDVFGTPLHAAIAGGNKEVYNLLIDEYNADVNAGSAAFGNAMQMALAIKDEDLLQSLLSHGALYDPNDRRGRIWHTAVDYNPELGSWPLPFSTGSSMLRICLHLTHHITDPFTFPLHCRLMILNTCVSLQRDAANLNTPARGCLSSLAAQRLRSASIITGGYISIVLIWKLIFDNPELLGRHGAILLEHDRFIGTFEGIIKDTDLEERLAKLFKHILADCRHLVDEPGLKPECSEVVEELHRYAQEREMKLKETLSIDRHSAVMSAMDKMAGEISGMKQQIMQLTSTVQLLLDLQQKSPTSGRRQDPDLGNTGPSRPSVPSGPLIFMLAEKVQHPLSATPQGEDEPNERLEESSA